MKAIIFDAGTIINFAMNGLLDILVKLKKDFKGKFLITEKVKEEIIDKPLTIKRFELEALMIKKLLDEGILELPYDLIKREKIISEKNKLLDLLNHTYYTKGEFIKIVHGGGTSSLALSLLLSKNGIDNIVAIDERTARMLVENPENLRQLFSQKLHTKVEMKKDLSLLKGIRIVRSSELLYLAYKKGLVDLKDHNILEALLYASKFKGCSISFEEIEEIKNLEK
ncbi:MAG: hypothetical protein QXF25_00665 [Candidatus Pacearchaeota archaeon]